MEFSFFANSVVIETDQGQKKARSVHDFGQMLKNITANLARVLLPFSLLPRHFRGYQRTHYSIKLVSHTLPFGV